MPPKQKYTDPKLRDEVKEDIKQSDKGGAPGQWSARKAQMMAKEYKNRDGDYNTPKSDKDESQEHLEKWGEEEWQKKKGSANAKKSDGSRERYLPKKALEDMSESEKEKTDQKKQEESKEGKQFVGNTSRAKRARKNANEKEHEEYEARKNGEENKGDEEEAEKPQGTAKTGQKRARPKKDTAAKDGDEQEIDDRPPKSAIQSKKRDRPKKENHCDTGEDEEEPKEQPPAKKKQQKKGEAANGDSGKTIGSKKDKATPPAQQASLERLPKKGTQAYWKAMPGWVDGKVVEVRKKGKSVDGKQVKASKDDPKVVLQSNSSGKLCVHKVDNVYFD